nr:hypothetical protein [Tanacetum cinerariifolium]
MLALSGENDEDWITRVEILYKTHVGTEFKHKSAWIFLKGKHKWTNPESTNARRYRFRVTDEEPEHFRHDALPQPPGLQRIAKSSGPDWLFDIDAVTRTMNYDPIVAGTQSNGFASTKASDYADPKSSNDDGSKPSTDDGKKVDEDPRKEMECNDQEKEDNVNSTNNVNTVSSTVNI